MSALMCPHCGLEHAQISGNGHKHAARARECFKALTPAIIARIRELEKMERALSAGVDDLLASVRAKIATIGEQQKRIAALEEVARAGIGTHGDSCYSDKCEFLTKARAALGVE